MTQRPTPDLHIETSGSGPVLLMISGGTGAANAYAAVAALLADQFTVITYDRRGHFASADARDQELTVATHGRDAADILRSVKSEPALVFGSSAGAVIGLELTARFPDLVRGLIAHEPPLIELLEDRERWTRWARDLTDINNREGATVALARFAVEVAGAAARDGDAEWDLLFREEWPSISEYRPDLDALRAGPPIVPAFGEASRGYWHARTAQALAEALDVRCEELPGTHLPQRQIPEEFAARLRPLLRGELAQQRRR